MDTDGSRKIFLSHKGSYKDTVTDYSETLKELGYEPWLDDHAMPAGTPRERGLLQGMQESCAAVFFVTPSFEDEGYLATEIEYAIEEKRRKGDRFSIIPLRLGGGAMDEAPEVPGLLNRYIWKTPKTPLEALREIVRALPIALGKAEWRDQRNGTAETHTPSFSIVNLSQEARTLLYEAARGDGQIVYTRTLGGQFITADRKAMITEQDPRIIARWVGGLEELEQLGYIKDVGFKRNLFEVTREGYKASDETFGTD